MASIILYDPADPTVADRVIAYFPSAHTPDYDLEVNKLVNPDLSGVAGLTQKYWKRSGSTVIAMSAGEQTAMDATDETAPGKTESPAEQSTTGTGWVQKVSRPVEVGEGDYLVLFYAEIRSTDSGTVVKVRVQEDNTTNLLNISYHPDPNQNVGWGPVSGSDVRTLTQGSHTFDMDFTSSQAGKAVFIRSARITTYHLGG